jgi:hypothetical protein
VSGGLRLGPISLVRICSTPWSALDELRAEQSACAASRLERAEEEFRRETAQLLGSLHGLVARQTCKAARGELIRAQRDIHNGRPAQSWLPHLAAVGDLDSIAELDALRAREAQRVELESALERTYALERTDRAARLRELAAQAIGPSLALVAPSLAAAAEPAGPAGSRREARRAAKDERVLYAYLARSASRTTPFADFAFVCPVDWRPGARPAAALPRRRIARLNREVVARLVKALSAAPGLRERVRLRVEPTAFAEGDTLCFSGTTPQGEHTLMTLPATPALLQLWQALRAGPACLAALAGLGAQDERAAAALLSVGFLAPEWDALLDGPGWEEQLIGGLEALTESAAAARGAALLRSTRVLLRSLPEQSTAQRLASRARLEREWSGALREAGAAELRPRELLCYEDCSGAAVALDRTRHEPALLALSRWIEATLHLSWTRLENGAMRCVFDQYYGAAVARVPLLEFFRDYFARYMVGALPPSARLGAVSLREFALRKEIEGQRAQLRDHLEALCRGADPRSEVELKLADLHFLSPARAAGSPRSAAVFALPLESGRLVVPSGRYQLGFGKFLSRFLDLLPERALAELRARYAALEQRGFAELRGGASFTGNVRPRLLSRAIAVPGVFAAQAESAAGGEEWCLEELEVCRSGADGVGLLRAGTPVVPLDTSFLDPRQAPPITRLLGAFGPHASFSACLPWRRLPEDGDGVRRRPRIALEGAVLLGRHAWLAPAGALPAAASPARQFAQLQAWQARLGLPERVYVKLRSSRELDVISPLHHSNRGLPQALGDWGQSRLLDLRSPFALEQLAHLRERLGSAAAELALEREEPLPGPLDSLWIDGARRACELVLHFEEGLE